MAQSGMADDARPESGDAVVSVRNVSMDFGSGPLAVDGATFDLFRGRFLTILGPSGSGKTTLLRIIAGFQRPTRGTVTVAGAAMDAVAPHRRSIGMVFQRLALFPHMTAAQNVAFPLKMRRHDPRGIADRVERFLDLVRLGGLGGRRIHELSGGQQQRVAIARALVFEPDLLLLDEPLAALDSKLREEMQLEFRRIQRELGVTTINVTHDQREALVMSDEIIVMDRGRIQQAAPPVQMYREPANAFVAGFIGVTNFLSGHAVEGGLRMGEITLAGRAAETMATGAPVQAAIRAEQVRIETEPARLAGLDTAFPAEVRDVIFEGDRLLCEVAVPALGGRVVKALRRDPEGDATLVPGAEVAVGWNARDLLIFASPSP